MLNREHIIAETKQWLQSFVIELNLCPFAKREIERHSLRIEMSSANEAQTAMNDFLKELHWLDADASVETTLLIFPRMFSDFYDYLDFVHFCEFLLVERNFEGVYQVASFHPLYRFANEPETEVSNYTNRSPYPMLHLLREHSLEKAIAFYGDTESIPQKNIQTMRKLGLQKIQSLLHACKK
ncbi:DUF1415 domain-containing protein [Legionella jordanis]|nr:DUF1415 domain-containing protein [Legionella jordanis]RMX18788.1 DUF1415 domain-containing protein [Legionella jordanis]HAT8713004.1 DUF1415 family protein [Legionella jordanis]